jgi:hypothetical protein
MTTQYDDPWDSFLPEKSSGMRRGRSEPALAAIEGDGNPPTRTSSSGAVSQIDVKYAYV